MRAHRPAKLPLGRDRPTQQALSNCVEGIVSRLNFSWRLSLELDLVQVGS
jgi:hypothetical protein